MTPQELLRVREKEAEAEADADFEFEQAQAVAPNGTPAAPAPPAQTTPTDIAQAAAPQLNALATLVAPPRTRTQGPARVAPPPPAPEPEPLDPIPPTPAEPAEFQTGTVDLPGEAMQTTVQKPLEAARTEKPGPRDVVPRSQLLANVFQGGFAGVPVGAMKAILGDSKFTRGVDIMRLLAAAQDADPVQKQRILAQMKQLGAGIERLPEIADWNAADEGIYDVSTDPVAGMTDETMRPAPPRRGTGIGGPLERVTQAAEVQRVERQKRALDGDTADNAGRGVRNTVTDALDNLGGLLVLMNEVAGVVMVERGERPEERMSRLSQEMIEGGLGSTADLAQGLTDLSANSFLTHPLTTWLTFVDPLVQAGKATPSVAARAAKIDDGFREYVVTPIVENVVDRALGAGDKATGKVRREGVADVWDEAKAFLKRLIVDGIYQMDLRATRLVEGLIHGQEEAAATIRNMGEVIARQVEQGLVNLDTPELERKSLAVVPPGVVSEAKAGERAVGAAETAAGKIGGLAEAADVTAGEAKGVKGAVNWLGKQANKAERGIAGGAAKAAGAIEKGADALGMDSARQYDAVDRIVDAAMPLVERIQKMDLPPTARAQILASKEAAAFEVARVEYARVASRAGQRLAYTNEPLTPAAQDALFAKSERGHARADAAGVREQKARDLHDDLGVADATLRDAKGMAAEAARDLPRKLKAFENAAEALKRHAEAVVEGVMAGGAKAATAGLGLVDAARAIDADTAAGMTREVASIAKGQARAAERQAERVAAEVEGAGERPQVEAGDVYAPPGELPPGERVTAQQPGAATFGQQQSLADLFPTAPRGALADLEAATARASELKRDALAAGFPEAQDLPPTTARFRGRPTEGGADVGALGGAVEGTPIQKATARWGLPADATLYDVARAAAEDFKDRAVGMGKEGGIQGTLEAELRLLGVPEPAVAPSAGWFLAEVEARDHAKRLAVPHGAIHRPPPEVMQFDVNDDGTLTETPEAQRLRAATADADLPEPGPARRALQESREMADRRVVAEAPKPYRTDNAVVNAALDKIGAEMRKHGYYADLTTPGRNVATEPMRLADFTPQKFVEVKDAELRRLTAERIQQQLLDPLVPDSTQLMQVPVVRNAALTAIARNARKAGMSAAAIGKLKGEFAHQLSAPKREAVGSKQRFVEFKYRGEPIWTRADYAKLQDSLPKSRVQQAQAKRIRELANEAADTASVYGQLQEYNAEVNRFRRTPKGETLTATLGDVFGYAKEVAWRVLGEAGELMPQMMPFSGVGVAAAMRTNAADWSAQLRVPEAAVKQLAGRLEGFKALKETPLQKGWAEVWKDTFRSVEPETFFDNIYVKPSVVSSLQADFFMRTAGRSLWGPIGIVTALAARSKAGVVAENLKTLLFNNLSNIALDIVTEANPTASVSDPLFAAWMLKAHLDGRGNMLGAADRQMIAAMADSGIVQTTQVARDIGETMVWKRFEQTAPEAARKFADVSARTSGKAAAPFEAFSDFVDMQRDAYSQLGDVPFRLAKAMRTYRNLEGYFDKMEPGTTIKVPTGTTHYAEVKALGDGNFAVVEVAGSRATLPGDEAVYHRDSPELARIKALAGKVAQEKLYFDYGRIGNFGKYLRGGGPLSLLSGIFSWFFKAADVPGIKRGLVQEALSGPQQYETTSRAVAAEQAQQRLAIAYKRAVAAASIRGATQDDRQQRELRQLFSFQPEMEGAYLTASTHPWHANVRDVMPLMWASPSAAVAGGLEGIANSLAFGHLFDDPVQLRAMLRPSADALASAATGEDDPVVAKAKLKAMGPAAAAELLRPVKERQARARAQLTRYALGRDFNVEKAINLTGLGGAPILNILSRMKESAAGGRKYSASDATRDFAKQMFGANVTALQNVAAGALGEAGIDSAASWSTYGHKQARQGFKSGEMGADEANFVRWAVKELAGVGYAEVLYAEGVNPETGGALRGQLVNYLVRTKIALKDSLLKEAKAQASRGVKGAQAKVEIINDIIDDEMEALKNTIERQFLAMRRKATERAVVKPAPAQ